MVGQTLIRNVNTLEEIRKTRPFTLYPNYLKSPYVAPTVYIAACNSKQADASAERRWLAVSYALLPRLVWFPEPLPTSSPTKSAHLDEQIKPAWLT